MALSLSEIRDMLLPGICFLNKDADKNWDLVADYLADTLYLVSGDERHELFTREEILDNLHRIYFRPRALKIMNPKAYAKETA